MFRELTRKKQQLLPAEWKEVLKTVRRGVLSVTGEEGYPYGMPMNHFYDEETGHLFFHSGRTGHRVDAMGQNSKASYCVVDAGTHVDGDWALTFRSVIVFGRLQVVEDPVRGLELCRRLCRCFMTDEGAIEAEIRSALNRTLFFELIPEQITGKRVREA